jgi:hypothetical protein
MGGQGGRPLFCGDGIIDILEECDDLTNGGEDPCNNCLVECPAGAKEEPTTHHCYILFSMSDKNWTDAKAHCIQQGYYLASITSAGEQAFVSTLDMGERWIGATNGGGTWTWESGDAWGYTNWEPTQGNEGPPRCLDMRAGTQLWNDDNCPEAKDYICEWEPPGM